METITATATTDAPGPLSRIVMRWTDMMVERATPGAPADWDAFTPFVAIDTFKRVGAYQEEMSWPEMVAFLTAWAGTTRFETTVFRMTEAGRIVIQEIEERHFHGDDFILKNVIAVYAFDDENRIRHLDIYEQAKDTGRWIVDAAHAAVEAEPA